MIKAVSPSILITGGNKGQRRKKAEEIAGFAVSHQENNPDFFFLAEATSLGIEEIRRLQKTLMLKPFKAKQKTAFIEEAQNLTPEAQNSLLKTLEEPPENSLLLMSVPDESLLLPTLISRCEVVALPVTAQIVLSDEEKTATQKFFQSLLSASLPERMVLAEKEGLFKDREMSLSWLDQLTVIVREELLTPYLDKKKADSSASFSALEILAAIARAKKYLEANCNLRLALEVFLSEIS